MFSRSHVSHTHTCYTGLADGSRPSVRRPGEEQHSILYVWSVWVETCIYRHVFFCAHQWWFFSAVLSAVNVLASQYFPVREPLKHCMVKTLMFRTPSTSTTPCSKSTHFQIHLCIPTNNTPTHLVTYSFQFIFLQILASHMHLHLWQIDQQTQNMDSLVCISLSDMWSAGSAWKGLAWDAVTLNQRFSDVGI
jgi:hypothetical protein